MWARSSESPPAYRHPCRAHEVWLHGCLHLVHVHARATCVLSRSSTHHRTRQTSNASHLPLQTTSGSATRSPLRTLPRHHENSHATILSPLARRRAAVSTLLSPQTTPPGLTSLPERCAATTHLSRNPHTPLLNMHLEGRHVGIALRAHAHAPRACLTSRLLE